MPATGPYFWTQTIKWMDPGGVARARWHRLDLANNSPFSSCPGPLAPARPGKQQPLQQLGCRRR